MTNDKLIIGTRGSLLALWQTNWVKAQLENHHRQLAVEIKIISTKGDRVQDISLPKLGQQGKGLFTQELEDAMFANEIDLAVHSLKDLPTKLPSGLSLAAICEREDGRDAFVARQGITAFPQLPESARVGTSSLRREAQLRASRPDLHILPVRGNVDTRLRKLDGGEYDAIILAAAGLRRLGYEARITQYLNAEVMLSAVGQGALGIETRDDDERVKALLKPLDHQATRLACTAERAFLKGLGGGCLVPIAAYCQVIDDALQLDGLVAKPDGTEIIRGQQNAKSHDAETLGQRLAEELLSRGAARLLASLD
ncbi:MAG: hydroxymethylbilane synthase [Acidobacteria bacterium]|nr:hydroxymethylbilane synthase [Acidobacteriota bacterium]